MDERARKIRIKNVLIYKTRYFLDFARWPPSRTRRNGRNEIDERERVACHPSLARGHKVEEPGGRVSSERPIDGGRRAVDPLSPVTLRPLAGPQGYRLSPALPQSPSAARHGPDGRPDHLAVSQAQ